MLKSLSYVICVPLSARCSSKDACISNVSYFIKHLTFRYMKEQRFQLVRSLVGNFYSARFVNITLLIVTVQFSIVKNVFC